MKREKIQAAVIQQRRREVLACLLDAYPQALKGDVILKLLLDSDPTTAATEVHKDLAYLSDKGYVEVPDAATNEPWKNRFHKLTARGNEVANRIVDDQALGYPD